MYGESSKKRYYKRIRERHLWVKFGLPLFVFGFSCIILSIAAIFLNVSFSVVRTMSSIGFGGFIIGVFALVLFGRLGWSESRVVDFLLNRVGVILIIFGQTLIVIHLSLGYASEVLQKDSISIIVGTVLVLLGIVFHSPYVDDSID